MKEAVRIIPQRRKRPRAWRAVLLQCSVVVVNSFDFGQGPLLSSRSVSVARVRPPSVVSSSTARRTAGISLFSSFSSLLLVAEISTSPTKNHDDDDDDLLSSLQLSLPPWLARPCTDAFVTSSEEEGGPQRFVVEVVLQEEWELLQMELEDQGWDETDIETVWGAIRSTASASVGGSSSSNGATASTNMEWTILGCVEFLKTLLQFPDLATPTVVLASILHYFECVLARQEGVYDTVRQRLMSPTTTTMGRSPSRSVLALPPYPKVIDTDLVQDATSKTTPVDRRKQKRVARRKHRRKLKQKLVVGEHELQDAEAALSSTAVGDDASSPFSEEIVELARAASQIKRAEIVSEIVLARKRKPDHDKLQSLLVSVSGEDWRALAIRCIASLYRLQASDPVHRHPELIATARSAMQVYAPLAQRMGLHVLKTCLENKAFYHLYPRQYNAAVAIFEHRGDSMKSVEQYLQQQIGHLLQQDPNLKQVDWQVTTRVKEPYSLWKKLLRKSMPGTMHWMLHPGDEATTPKVNASNPSPSSKEDDTMHSMLRIRDGVALRIIVQSSYAVPGEPESERQNRDHVACYYVHHLIRSVFPESHPGHVKDYIANPKRNGYQSLHHTSSLRMNGLEIPFEIQVRSHDMHRVAEFGVAAHWDYKRGDAAAATAIPTRTTTAGRSPTVALATLPRRSSPEKDDSASVDPFGSTGSLLTRTAPSMTTSSTPYLQALEVARKSLVRSSAFVFVAGTSMEHGQLVSVTKGERVMDIWNQVFSLTEQQQQQGAQRPQRRRSNVPNEKKGSTSPMTVWRNGRLAELNETVQNGDVLLFQQENEEAEVDVEPSGQQQQQRQSHLSLRRRLLKATSSSKR